MRGAAKLVACTFLIACGGEDVSNSTESTVVQSTGAPPVGVDSTAWARVTESRIYFGHQSVGRNIIDGLRELSASHTERPLTIVASREAASTPALVEFTVGENGRPESKLADFTNAVNQIGDTAGAIAIFKYCYLDFTAETDVEQLFARHRDAVRAIRVRHPRLTFVHVTTPLTTTETGPRYLVKRLLGKSTTRDANAKRNAFNAMLLKEFSGEPVFDLARVESTRPDGSRSFFTAGGDTVYTLAPELTDDGGHLNAAGRRAAAAALTAVIARDR